MADLYDEQFKNRLGMHVIVCDPASADMISALRRYLDREREARERAEGALREVDKQVTELIKIDAEIANRRYLPSLENARTIRDARAIVDRYDGYQMTLVERIKKVVDSLRALAALKSSQEEGK